MSESQTQGDDEVETQPEDIPSDDEFYNELFETNFTDEDKEVNFEYDTVKAHANIEENE